MEQDDFRDFGRLKEFTTQRSPVDCNLSDAHFFRVNREYMLGYEIGISYSQLEQRKSGTLVRVVKGQGKRHNANFDLSMIAIARAKPSPITQAKLDDLHCLMDLIPPLEFRSFWDDTLRKAACIIAGSTEGLPEPESDDGTLPDGPGLLGVMDDYN